jgi:hypothetical protein
VFSIKSPDDRPHYRAAHEIRLAPDPETLTVDIESPRFPLIKPESEIGRSLYLLLSEMCAFQSGFIFYTKIALIPGKYRSGNIDLLTIKKQACDK